MPKLKLVLYVLVEAQNKIDLFQAGVIEPGVDRGKGEENEEVAGTVKMLPSPLPSGSSSVI